MFTYFVEHLLPNPSLTTHSLERHSPRMFGGPSFSVSGSSNERKTETPGFASSITMDRHKSGIPLSWVNTQDDKRSSAQSSNIYANSSVSDSTLLIHQAP